MGVVEIFPDLLIKESGSKTVTGAASVLAALNDLSDTSYVVPGGATPPSYGATFRLGSLGAIPAGAIITKVQLKMRYTHFVKFGATYEKWVPTSVLVGRTAGTKTSFLGFTTGEAVPSFFTTTTPVNSWVGPYRPETWDGKFYLNELLMQANTRLYISLNVVRNWAYNLSRIYSLSANVHYNEMPMVTLTEPSGAEVVGRPTFTWTYDDPEDDPQVVINARVYDASVAGLPGFTHDDTEAFPPAYDSGDVWTSEDVFKITRSIPDGSYAASLRATHAGMAGEIPWSDWSSTLLTVTTTPPVAPVVTATYDAVSNSINVLAQGKDNLLTWELSSFEPTTPYTPSWIIGTNTTAARSTAQFKHGAASLIVTRTTSAGTAQVLFPAAVGVQFGIPAEAGVTYSVRLSSRAAVTSRSFRVGIRWLNSGGGTISDVFGSNVANSNANFTAEATHSAVAPANTKFFRIIGEVLSAGIGEQHYFDQVGGFIGTVSAWNRGGYINENHTIFLQKSLDGGTTWEDYPTSLAIVEHDHWMEQTSLADYEVPSGTTATYRARTESPNEDDEMMIGPWSTTSSAVMASFSSWWIRDIVNPELSMAIRVSEFEEEDDEPQTFNYPLDSELGVVSSDGHKKGPVTISGFLLDAASYDMFNMIIQSPNVILLQDTLGHQWFLRPMPGTVKTRLRAAPVPPETTLVRHAHTYTAKFHQVEKPTHSADTTIHLSH